MIFRSLVACFGELSQRGEVFFLKRLYCPDVRQEVAVEYVIFWVRRVKPGRFVHYMFEVIRNWIVKFFNPAFVL